MNKLRISALLAFLSTFAHASYSPQTIVTDAADQTRTLSITALGEAKVLGTNACKETGGNLASLLSEITTLVSGSSTISTHQTDGTQKTQIAQGGNSASVKAAFTAPSTADPSLVVAISPNSPITVTSVPPTNSHTTGVITTACASGVSCSAGSTVQVATSGYSTIGFETHGTWNALVTQDVSYDPACEATPNAALWYQVSSIDTGADDASYVSVWDSTLNDDPWVMNVTAAQCARIRAVSLTSGSIDVVINTGVGSSMVWSVPVGNSPSGSTDSGNPVKIGGVYNSTLPTFTNGQRSDLQVDSRGRTIVAPLSNSSVVKSQIQDNAGTGITSTLVDGIHQAIDVNAVGITSATVGDLAATGTITGVCATPTAACPAGSFVQLSINGVASAQLQVGGTFSGASLNVDGSEDGTTWVALLTASGSTGVYSTAAFSAAGKYRIFRIAGLTQLRVRASALASGSVAAMLNASLGSNLTEAVQLTPANFLSTAYLNDGSGNPVTSQVSGSQRALDVGINVSGTQIDPRARTWSLLNSTDSVNSVQSGIWTTGRTWTLGSGTDSISSAQSGTWTTGRTWTLSSGTDSVSAAQSGTWNVTNISGTVSLPTGAATAALQTTQNTTLTTIDTDIKATQPRKMQDGAGNNLTSQASGSQRALDVGINVAGVQVDPRTRTWSLLNSTDSVNAVQSGTWNVTNISGTVSLPTNAAQETGGHLASMDTKLGTTVAQDATVTNVQGSVGAGAAATKSALAGGVFNTVLPTLTNGQQSAVQFDSSGRLITRPLTTSDAVTASQGGTWTVQQGATPTTNANGWAVKPGDGTNTQSYTASGEAKVLVTPLTNSSVVKAQLQDNAGTAITLGQKTAASSVPVVLASDQSGMNTNLDKNATGNITALNGTVTVATNGTSDLTVSVTGTWSATLSFEASNDGGSTYAFTPKASTTAGLTSSTAANGTFKIAAGGFTNVRVRASAFVSGTASVVMNAGAGASLSRVYQDVPASLTTQVYGSTTGAAIQTDASSNLQVVGSVASGAADSGAPVKVGGKYNSTQPTLTTGNRGDVQISKFGDMTTADSTSFANITAATTTVVKSGAGLLYAICLNNAINAATITIYDNTAGSGTTIGAYTQAVGGGAYNPVGCQRYDGMNFNTGLTVVTSAASNVTVLYK